MKSLLLLLLTICFLRCRCWSVVDGDKRVASSENDGSKGTCFVYGFEILGSRAITVIVSICVDDANRNELVSRERARLVEQTMCDFASNRHTKRLSAKDARLN
jgi:hypothetical protein